jgi:hypothetical protein
LNTFLLAEEVQINQSQHGKTNIHEDGASQKLAYTLLLLIINKWREVHEIKRQ